MCKPLKNVSEVTSPFLVKKRCVVGIGERTSGITASIVCVGVSKKEGEKQLIEINMNMGRYSELESVKSVNLHFLSQHNVPERSKANMH